MIIGRQEVYGLADLGNKTGADVVVEDNLSRDSTNAMIRYDGEIRVSHDVAMLWRLSLFAKIRRTCGERFDSCSTLAPRCFRTF